VNAGETSASQPAAEAVHDRSNKLLLTGVLPTAARAQEGLTVVEQV
jgi:hypothetical protein